MVFRDSMIMTGYRNTLYYTILGTAINLVMTVLAAYPLSRKDWVGRGFFMAVVMFTMFFSGGTIPTYLLMNDLGLINTTWAIVLPGRGERVQRHCDAHVLHQFHSAGIAGGRASGWVQQYAAAAADCAAPFQTHPSRDGAVLWRGALERVLWRVDLHYRIRPLSPATGVALHPHSEHRLAGHAGRGGHPGQPRDAAETIKYALIIVSTLP